MKARRQARSMAPMPRMPAAMPLMPAMRPASSISITEASPISAPPMAAESGVKLAMVASKS